jgi:hypothetical protein
MTKTGDIKRLTEYRFTFLEGHHPLLAKYQIIINGEKSL